jgi:Domain of unknown function (DUF4337)
MRAEDTTEHIETAGANTRSRWVAVYIAVLAVLLAVGALGGSNATKDVINGNIAASNAYAFFQAKSIRQTSLRLAAQQLEAMLQGRSDLPEAARGELVKAIAGYRATAQRYESEPASGDGKRELLAKARKHEVARDRAQRRDPYFDYSQALIQIAIVLASVSLIVGSAALIRLSYVLAGLGALLLVNGFTLAVSIGLLE